MINFPFNTIFTVSLMLRKFILMTYDKLLFNHLITVGSEISSCSRMSQVIRKFIPEEI